MFCRVIIFFQSFSIVKRILCWKIQLLFHIIKEFFILFCNALEQSRDYLLLRNGSFAHPSNISLRKWSTRFRWMNSRVSIFCKIARWSVRNRDRRISVLKLRYKKMIEFSWMEESAFPPIRKFSARILCHRSIRSTQWIMQEYFRAFKVDVRAHARAHRQQ